MFTCVVIESFHRSRFVFFFLFFFRKWFRRHRLFSLHAYDGRRPTAAPVWMFLMSSLM
jgi:hypothetical protein